MSIRFILILLLLGLTQAHAEIYKWVDADGKVQFGDRPPPIVKETTKPLELQINTYSAPEIVYIAPVKKQKKARAKKVVMYSAEWCGVCKRAASYFKTNKIRYKEYDVDKTEKGRKAYKKLNGRGVPIILVGKSRMNGFSPAQFEQLYTQ